MQMYVPKLFRMKRISKRKKMKKKWKQSWVRWNGHRLLVSIVSSTHLWRSFQFKITFYLYTLSFFLDFLLRAILSLRLCACWTCSCTKCMHEERNERQKQRQKQRGKKSAKWIQNRFRHFTFYYVCTCFDLNFSLYRPFLHSISLLNRNGTRTKDCE